MKSINSKITVILIVSFLLQVVLIGSLYRLIIAKSLLTDINGYETARQKILQGAVTRVEKVIESPELMAALINTYSKKQGVEFVVNDLEGNIVFSNRSKESNNNSIEEIGFARLKKKPVYEVHAYFPIKAKSLARYTRLNGTRLILILIVFSISMLTSFLIYEILSVPLKKVRKAMKSISYGNTLTNIPYYGNDELGLLCRNFEDMGKRLKKSEEEQGELIQAISHDLKTPMTSILGYMSRLIDGKVTSEEKKKEYYEIIYRKTNDLKLLLNDLEEYGSLGRGMKFEKQPVDCNKFIKDMCEEMKCEVKERGGEFRCSSNITGSYEMMIDESKIRRVFVNIIENSFKYAGEGCEISIEAGTKDNCVLFEICDNGQGVPEEKLDKIFDKFYRIDSSRSREKGGTGLGLTICRGIIEGHGGRIYAENSSAGGLCIGFTIPARKVS